MEIQEMEMSEIKSQIKQHLGTLEHWEIDKVKLEISGECGDSTIDISYIPDLSKQAGFNKDEFHNLFHEYLNPGREIVPFDWINDDGGYGIIHIEVRTGKAEGKLKSRETGTTHTFKDWI